ncbi:hypothetical protein VST7929_01988 [Vibrio stylophorae]|uniref:Uncharacterized protein n=1 Tax=Vibrio stylophorae TaxID=659351 RepID=A0ABM8ZUT8_9VIBR|nr:hypothetical protein VST7929_01988 [Vibrio stylophorae]
MRAQVMYFVQHARPVSIATRLLTHKKHLHENNPSRIINESLPPLWQR